MLYLEYYRSRNMITLKILTYVKYKVKYNHGTHTRGTMGMGCTWRLINSTYSTSSVLGVTYSALFYSWFFYSTYSSLNYRCLLERGSRTICSQFISSAHEIYLLFEIAHVYLNSSLEANFP